MYRHACDRRKPSCTRCHRRGINCVYPEAAPTLKKLQEATKTFGNRLKIFRERLKAGEITPLQPHQYYDYDMGDTLDENDIKSPYVSSVKSMPFEDDDDDMMEIQQDNFKGGSRRGRGKVASTRTFSVYPCVKCTKDLQQCDLTLPKCTRCEANNFDCTYTKTEPKANHVSQVLTTMNKVMDHWQYSIDRIAKELTQKSTKRKPPPRTAWKITTTKEGLSVHSNVNSFNDFSTLVDQFRRTMSHNKARNHTKTLVARAKEEPIFEFDEENSIHTTSEFTVWDSWAHPTHAMPQDYPIDISEELTDNLIELYCRTPCCSSIRLPIIDIEEFLVRYRNPDVSKRPSTVLVYAVCAMAARNAFQLHVWSKRPAFEAPQYNMGKALSVAYGLRGRELLSECFDEPSLENCQAAFLLSYSNYQNGYPGVIYFYEWIAYNMAVQLGLYNSDRELTQCESMLVWGIYYCNAWYKALQGGNSGTSQGVSQCKPNSPLPRLLNRPDQSLFDKQGDPEPAVVKYYVWNCWVYLIQLQVFRDQSVARLASFESGGDSNNSLLQDVVAMQETLKAFHSDLPTVWQSPNFDVIDNEQPCCTSTENFKVNVQSFAQYCVNLVSMHYSVNEIILHQAFIPMDRLPNSAISINALETCLNAANNINRIFELMVQKENCHVPLIGYFFSNIVHQKLLNYTFHDTYYKCGKNGLLHSIDISKSSFSYKYDFEMARTLIRVMEENVQCNIMRHSPSAYSLSIDSSADSSPTPSIPSPTNYSPLGQTTKG